MKFMIRLLKILLIFSLLTLLTQVGGLVYLCYLYCSRFLPSNKLSKLQQTAWHLGLFTGLFLLSSLLLVPTIAPWFGRVPLPIFLDAQYPVRPANLLTCLTNRHYVKPPLLQLIKEVAQEINEQQTEQTEILYLDANFPFIDNFPLLPHKSHDDGEKLDICFLFRDKTSQKRLNEPMSFLGYGACLEPQKGETNMPSICAKKGYFQYSLLKKFASQHKIKEAEFDLKANRQLLISLAKKKATGKIFIEPHLKERLRLSKYRKIRFHGCAAVRHDDHIHLQL